MIPFIQILFKNFESVEPPNPSVEPPTPTPSSPQFMIPFMEILLKSEMLETLQPPTPPSSPPPLRRNLVPCQDRFRTRSQDSLRNTQREYLGFGGVYTKQNSKKYFFNGYPILL